MEIISLRQFAERIGVSLTAVQKGEKNGRIKAIRDSKTGKITGIDWETQSAAWEANSKAPQRRPHNPAGGRPRLDGKPVAAPKTGHGANERLEDQPHGGALKRKSKEDGHQNHNDLSTLAGVQRARELVKLQTDSLKLQQMRGELVAKSEQQKLGHELGSSLISDLYNLPERLSDELAGMGDPNAIHALMTKEIDNMVRQIRSKLGAV